MRLLLMVLTALVLNACQTASSPGTLTHQWVGQNKETLLNQWGFPNAITTLPDGSTDYEYIRTITRPFPYPATPDGVIVVGQKGTTIGFALPPNNPQKYNVHCFTNFVMTPDNVVKSVQQKGVGCY